MVSEEAVIIQKGEKISGKSEKCEGRWGNLFAEELLSLNGTLKI